MRDRGSGEVYLLGDNMLSLLFLFLCVQLLFHVLDVPGEAMAVKVVVTRRLGKGLLLLWEDRRTAPVSVHSLALPVRSASSQIPAENPPGSRTGR